jgi:excisionase family DNA binding protein
MEQNRGSPARTVERPWLTPDEVAELLSISLNTLRQYVSKRKIPFIKVPGSNLVRFDSGSLRDWMKQGLKEVKADGNSKT